MRRCERGFTLIETMIVVAILGVTSLLLGNAALQQRQAGAAELQRAEAEQLLDYCADRLSSGQRPSSDTVDALAENLPSTKLAIAHQGRLATLTLEWKEPSGRRLVQSLTVFAKGGGQ
jgi:prepilin-type N-terminal cleavage/methylation domain-containing protein